jgi:peptidyl-tRNA hydrolase
MKFISAVLFGMLVTASSVAQMQPAGGSGLPSAAIPKTTAVLVIETPKEGVTFPQVFAVIPQEARATVKLYLDGKIREWYSRGDGKGVVFLVDATSVEEAKAIIESLPLAKEQLMDNQYIPVGPLVPLRVLAGPGAQQ